MHRKTTVVLSDGEELELELEAEELSYLLSTPATMIVFIRVPKARSQLLERIARRNYQPHRWGELANMFTDPARSRAELAGWAQKSGGIDLLSGEIAFDLDAFPTEALSFTLLRDPVDRTISQSVTAHRQSTRKGELPADLSLDDAIAQGVLDVVDNLQTRQLAGAAALDDPPRGECPRTLLDAAIENVGEHIQCTGLAERLDESVVLCAQTFGWDDFAYKPVQPTLPELKAETIEQLRAENALDLELYQFAEDRFSEAIRAAGSEFDYRLQALRRCFALLDGADGKPAPAEIEEHAAALYTRLNRAEKIAAQQAEQLAGDKPARKAASPRSAKSSRRGSAGA